MDTVTLYVQLSIVEIVLSLLFVALFLNIRYHNGGTKEPLIDAAGLMLGYYALSQTSCNLTRSMLNPALAFNQQFFQFALRKSLLFNNNSIDLTQLLPYFFGPLLGGMLGGFLSRLLKNQQLLVAGAAESAPAVMQPGKLVQGYSN